MLRTFLSSLVPLAALLTLSTAVVAQEAPTPAPAPAPSSSVNTSFGKEKEVRRLAKLMEGNYNSAKQAAADKEYFDIRLHIKRIWKERPDSEGIYFYVEQATAAAQQRPYRQRVYHLRTRKEDGKIESVVYTLKAPLRFAGQWKEDKPLAMLTPDSLVERAGCSVMMRRHKRKEYRGATEGQQCPSDLRGAKYATTDVIITPKQLISWDRGFDEKGDQVWGAKFGGYIFEKEAAGTQAPPVTK